MSRPAVTYRLDVHRVCDKLHVPERVVVQKLLEFAQQSADRSPERGASARQSHLSPPGEGETALLNPDDAAAYGTTSVASRVVTFVNPEPDDANVRTYRVSAKAVGNVATRRPSNFPVDDEMDSDDEVSMHGEDSTGDQAGGATEHDVHIICSADDSIQVEVMRHAATDAADAASPSTAAHTFLDDVIDRIVIFKDLTSGALIMHVNYHRPWWTYVIALISVLLTAVAWSASCFGSYGPSLGHDYTMHATIKLFTFLYVGAVLFVALIFVFTWQLSWRDRRDLRSPKLVGRLVICCLAGGLAKLLFVVAMMLVVTTTHIAIYVSLPLVAVVAHRFFIGRHLVWVDIAGAAIILGGCVMFFVGEIFEQRDSSTSQRVGAVFAAIAAAGLEAAHRVWYKYLRPVFSHRMVLSGVMTSTAILLLMLAFFTNSLNAPSGHHRTAESLDEMGSHSLTRLAICIVALSVAAFLDLDTASFFDVITTSAVWTVVTPVAVVLFRVFHLPHTAIGYEVGACLCVVIGTFAVVWSGLRHRRRVRLQIVTRD